MGVELSQGNNIGLVLASLFPTPSLWCDFARDYKGLVLSWLQMSIPSKCGRKLRGMIKGRMRKTGIDACLVLPILLATRPLHASSLHSVTFSLPMATFLCSAFIISLQGSLTLPSVLSPGIHSLLCGHSDFYGKFIQFRILLCLEPSSKTLVSLPSPFTGSRKPPSGSV